MFSGIPAPLLSKFRISPRRGCWEWIGEIDKGGYGRAWYKGYRYQAHRLFYFFIGTEKFDLDNRRQVIDHLCENRCCVNPSHCEPTTQATNVKRIYRRRKKINAEGELIGAKK